MNHTFTTVARFRILRVGLIAVVLTGLAFGQSKSQNSGPSQTMSLDECIDFALNNNTNVVNAGLENHKQEKVVGEILSEGLPQVTGSLNLQDNFEVASTPIPAIIFNPAAEPGDFAYVKFSPQYVGSASIGVSQMIFNGSYFVGVQAAKTFVQLSTKEETRTQIDVVEAVTKAYYSVLVNQEALVLTESNFGRLDSLLRETRLMFENGFAEKIDVNRVEIEFNNISTLRANAESLLDISHRLLKFQMGMPITQELQLSGDLEDLVSMEEEPFSDPEFHYSNRIEYSILETQERMVGFDLKNNRVQYLPRFDLNAGLGANTGDATLGDMLNVSNNWFALGYVGLSASLPIFDGFYKSSKIQQVKISQQQIQNQYDLLQNSIDLEILSARRTLETALRNLEAQEKNMSLSQEVYNVTKIKYQEGLGSNLEVIEADGAYQMAQNNYYNALYQVLIGKVDLDKALGVLHQ